MLPLFLVVLARTSSPPLLACFGPHKDRLDYELHLVLLLFLHFRQDLYYPIYNFHFLTLSHPLTPIESIPAREEEVDAV